MNISIVGLGKMGLLHAGIINSLSDANVTSVCEKDRLLARLAKSVLPREVTVYREVDKMVLEKDPDAAYVTTPIDTHFPIIDQLLRAKTDLNVFVEKPLTASYEQARLACEVSSHSKGVHMVGFQRRFSPVYRKAKELLMEGIIGEPIFFRAYCLSSDVLREGSAWRSRKNSGGVLLDLAPHLIDALIWFFEEPTGVMAVKKKVYSSQVEDYVHATLSYESGLQGHVDACWSVSTYRLPEVLLEIHGTSGMLTVTDDFAKYTLSNQANADTRSHFYNRQSLGVPTPFLLTDPEYTLEDVAFLDAARTRTNPETNFVEAAKVNALIDRILQSTK